MSRKEAFYFSHDSNARHDEKILAMRSVYKSEGYGWYWIIIELLRDANAYRLQCSGKYWAHAIATELLCEPEKCAEFINDCISEFNLFITDGGFFWSESLLRRMEKMELRSQKAAQSAQARWNRKPEDMQTHSERNANVSKSDALNEKKVNQKKVKEKKINQTINIEFDSFWDLYDKKVGLKEKIRPNWNNLTNDEREKAMEHIKKYKEAQPEKAYRKDPATYLNNKAFNDEIINRKQASLFAIEQPKKAVSGDEYRGL